MSVVDTWLKQFTDATVMKETLQKEDDPIVVLKAVQGKLVIVVPAEYAWPPNLNPGKNPTHKRIYDAELLAQQLEEAGFTYILKFLNGGSGWSWLTAECVKIDMTVTSVGGLTSKERRALKRHPPE